MLTESILCLQARCVLFPFPLYHYLKKNLVFFSTCVIKILNYGFPPPIAYLSLSFFSHSPALSHFSSFYFPPLSLLFLSLFLPPLLLHCDYVLRKTNVQYWGRYMLKFIPQLKRKGFLNKKVQFFHFLSPHFSSLTLIPSVFHSLSLLLFLIFRYFSLLHSFAPSLLTFLFLFFSSQTFAPALLFLFSLHHPQ